jgi:hypothetical protein
MDPTTVPTPNRVDHARCKACRGAISRRILKGEPGAWLHDTLDSRHRADPDIAYYQAGPYEMIAPGPLDPDPEWDDSSFGQPEGATTDPDPRCDCGREVDYRAQRCTPCADQARREDEEAAR